MSTAEEKSAGDSPKDLVLHAINDIANRQMMLSRAKINLELNEDRAKEMIRGVVECIEALALKFQALLTKNLNQMVTSRRAELELISNYLATSNPQLVQLYSGIAEGCDENSVAVFKQRLKYIMAGVDSHCSGEQWEEAFLSSIQVCTPDHYLWKLLHPSTPVAEMVSLHGCLFPNAVNLTNVDVKPGHISARFEIRGPPFDARATPPPDVKNFFPYVVLSEFTLTINAADGEYLLKETTFKDLKHRGLLTALSGRCLQLDFPFSTDQWRGRDVMLAAKLNATYICNSPHLVNLPSSSLSESEEANRRRSAENDLDESDMRAMGYLDMTNVAEKLARHAAAKPPSLPAVIEERTEELSGTSDNSLKKALTGERDVDNESDKPDALQEFFKSAAHIESQAVGPKSLDVAATIAAAVNLPLNQPSPVPPVIRRVRQEPMDNGQGPESPGFTPSVASTSSDLSAKLGQLNIPKLIERLEEVDQEDDDDANVSKVLGSGKLDIDAIQEKLSKYTMEDDPPSNAAACNGRSNNKNVSFAQETTILQEVSVESAAKNRTEEFEATQPYQPGSMDIKKATVVSEGAEADHRHRQWQIRTGTTKTTDGELALCKSLLKAQNEQIAEELNRSQSSAHTSFTDWSSLASSAKDSSLWNYTNEAWDKYMALNKGSAPNGHVVPTTQETMWLEEDRDTDLFPRPKTQPAFDLKTSVAYSLTKTFDFGDRGDVVPQSVARDPGMDITYVSDIANNHIHIFKGWDYHGVWNTQSQSLLAPRYVLCIPDKKHDNRHGMLVVVLDQVALYVFKADGSLKSKTFVDVAKRYRGLARHPGLGRLVTTEKVEGMGTYIVFIDEDTFEKVVMRTLIEPTAATEYYIQNTKCRFVTCAGDRVVTTDMGLGCFYVTDLKTRQTTSHTHSVRSEVTGADVNMLKAATDVFVDPAGNVVVATCDDQGGQLQLFTSHGVYVMPVKGIEVVRPVGVHAEGKNLYVVDVRTKVVELYSLCQSPMKSPVKKRNSN